MHGVPTTSYPTLAKKIAFSLKVSTKKSKKFLNYVQIIKIVY
jgi:hypothetical protein